MSSSGRMSRTSTPPIETLPSETSQKRATNRVSVVFPEPEGPTKAVRLRSGHVKLTPCSTGRDSS